MVLPIIAAGARVAGTTVARTGVAAARSGVQSVGRTTASAARKSTQSVGRNITRVKRNSVPMNSVNNTRPLNTTRSRGSNMVRQSTAGSIYSDQSEEQDQFEGIQMQSGQNRKQRIGNLMALILLMMAAFFDLTELALDLIGTFGAGIGVVIGYVKDFTSLLFFPTAFLLLGVPLWKGQKARKKMIAIITGIIVSAIPWIGAIMPETLISVAITIYLTRLEDRGADTSDSMNKNIVRAKRITQKFGR